MAVGWRRIAQGCLDPSLGRRVLSVEALGLDLGDDLFRVDSSPWFGIHGRLLAGARDGSWEWEEGRITQAVTAGFVMAVWIDVPRILENAGRYLRRQRVRCTDSE